MIRNEAVDWAFRPHTMIWGVADSKGSGAAQKEIHSRVARLQSRDAQNEAGA
jgi:hypothetical protein